MKKNFLLLLSIFAFSSFCEEAFKQGNIPPENTIVELTPSQISLPSCSADIFVKGSFLYWVVRNSSDIYSLSTDRADYTTGNLNEKQFEPSFDWRPGVQVALGANLNTKWNIDFEWTYIVGRASGKAKAPSSGFLQTLDYHSRRALGDGIGSAANHIHTHYQMLDALVSRPYYLDKRLTVTPFFGIRGGYIKNTNHSKYDNIHITFEDVSGGDLTVEGDWRVDRKVSKTWGVGLKAGASADALLGWGFRIFGSLDGSLLWTHIKNSYVETLSPDLASFFSTGSVFYSSKLDSHRLKPAFHLGSGFAWGSYFGDSYHLDVLLGYDFTLWMNFLTWRENQGDLWLHGLTASARLDF